MDAAPTRFQPLTRERLLVRRRNRILLGALTAIISLATIFIALGNQLQAGGGGSRGGSRAYGGNYWEPQRFAAVSSD